MSYEDFLPERWRYKGELIALYFTNVCRAPLWSVWWGVSLGWPCIFKLFFLTFLIIFFFILLFHSTLKMYIFLTDSNSLICCRRSQFFSERSFISFSNWSFSFFFFIRCFRAETLFLSFSIFLRSKSAGVNSYLLCGDSFSSQKCISSPFLSLRSWIFVLSSNFSISDKFPLLLQVLRASLTPLSKAVLPADEVEKREEWEATKEGRPSFFNSARGSLLLLKWFRILVLQDYKKWKRVIFPWNASDSKSYEIFNTLRSFRSQLPWVAHHAAFSQKPFINFSS